MGGTLLTALLIDTHVWAWSLTDGHRISERARTAIGQAQTILVSAISFYEVARKVGLGKWPEMVPYVDRLPELLDAQRAVVAPLEAADCLMAGKMNGRTGIRSTDSSPRPRFAGAFRSSPSIRPSTACSPEFGEAIWRGRPSRWRSRRRSGSISKYGRSAAARSIRCAKRG